MHKRFLLLLLTLFLSVPLFAQLEVKEGSFKKVDGFVNINLDIQTDDNEVPYAVVKVKTENINDKQRRELLFQGDAATFIECEYKVGEVWVYLTYKATYIKISHPDLSSTEFWFPFDMEPKKGYELTLVNVSKSEIDEERILNLIDKRLEDNSLKPETATNHNNNQLINSIERYFFMTINASINNYSDLTYGLTLGSVKKLGWFVTAMSSFDFSAFSCDYECGEDLKVNGDYPVYNGTESFTALSIMGGFIYRINKPLAIRIGAGYGIRNIAYETIDNKWVKNIDVSADGLDASIGVQYKIKKLVVSLDCVTTNFKCFEAKLGLGIGI